ncbi:MAG: hypothetical protein GY861_26065 [bacterium]|nr:hypothetical protein [bacterium]
MTKYKILMMNDIIYTDTLQIANGDFVVEDSKNQHTEHNLRANPGDYFQYPTLGAGINKKILNSSIDEISMRKKIKRSLEMDKYKLKDFLVNENGVYIATE